MADPRPSAANDGNGSAPDPRNGASLRQSIHPADYARQLQLLGQYGYPPNQYNFQNRTNAGGCDAQHVVHQRLPFAGQEETARAAAGRWSVFIDEEHPDECEGIGARRLRRGRGESPIKQQLGDFPS
jgi:hypothetical protein